MKSQKLLSLDIDIIDHLKAEDNGSALVQRLLVNHYGSGDEQEIEYLRQKLTDIDEKHKIEKEVLKSKLAILVKNDRKRRELQKKVPQEIEVDFKLFPQMTEEILQNRYADIYIKKFPKLKYEDILKAFKVYHA